MLISSSVYVNRQKVRSTIFKGIVTVLSRGYTDCHA